MDLKSKVSSKEKHAKNEKLISHFKIFGRNFIKKQDLQSNFNQTRTAKMFSTKRLFGMKNIVCNDKCLRRVYSLCFFKLNCLVS